MGSQLRRSRPHCGGIEATSLGVRAIEIAQAVDRKIGPRPPMRAVSCLPNRRRVPFVTGSGANAVTYISCITPNARRRGASLNDINIKKMNLIFLYFIFNSIEARY